MFGFSSRSFNSDNFRQNVTKNNLPKKSSISIEGLLNEYYFQTGVTNTTETVSPSFLVSSHVDPISHEKELYIAVGCNSKDDGKNVRNKLNLIVVLDISGSMGSRFSTHYASSESSETTSDKSKTKMQVAVDVLLELVGIMNPEERLGIILFDDVSQVLQPIRKLDSIDKEQLTEKIDGVTQRGGTSMVAGYTTALEMMTDMITENQDQDGYDNRIIFLTDAMPNSGSESDTLIQLSHRAAQKNIFTSFIGIGLDFNSDLVDKITKVKGSNYFSVHSGQQFKKILVTDFNYIVTPIAFNAVLFMESEGYQIDKVYGTPYDNDSSAIMKVDTVTASPKDEKGAKGGVVLLKVKPKLTSNENPSSVVKLTLVYEDRHGNKNKSTTEFDLIQRVEELGQNSTGSVYENTGIHKAILLVKYVNLMHQIIDSQNHKSKLNQSDGINTVKSNNDNSLEISKVMKQDLIEFITYFKQEIDIIGDKDLNKELDVLDQFRYAQES
jgi:Ca-activated chloride channel family protein